jgi:EAL and modified HD-GYP domain-containing signal transduction protein
MTTGPLAHATSGSSPQATSLKQSQVFISRQPLYDQQLNVVAYTVLLHEETEQTAQGYVATSQILEHAFIDIGLQAIVGQSRAYLRLTRGFFLLDYVTVFPPDRVILEISPDTPVDAELLCTVQALAEQGYTIALPDVFLYPALRPLVDVVHILSIDLGMHGQDKVQEQVPQLRPTLSKLFAYQVETPEDFAFCLTVGIDYVQGDFFCRPDLVQGQRAPTNRMAIMQLLAKLLHPETEFDELEAIIRCDLSLSYKLLQLINSSFFGLSKTITSIRQALLLLGTKQVTTWVSLMLLAGVDDKPHELAVTAMIRGRMCELLAQAMHQKNTDTYFLVGLFSLLDAVMDRPLSELLPPMPLAQEVSQALLYHQGLLGATLQAVVAYEHGNWELAKSLRLDYRTITDAYLQAIAWTDYYEAML